MKTYIISLERAKERNKYIKKHIIDRQLDHKIINATDGNLLTEKDIETNCNIKQVEKYPLWLSKGAIACAMSHLQAYEEFLKTDDKAAFIIEDDVFLPKDIKKILLEVEEEVKNNEVILLYYTTFSPEKISTIARKKLSSGGLFYPLGFESSTAAAYVIGRGAAQNLKENSKPIAVTADCWSSFYERNYINSLRLHYPSAITTKNFKSSIDYLKPNSVKGKIALFIDTYKIPILYQFMQFRRKKSLDLMLNNVSITDEPSPIYTKLISNV